MVVSRKASGVICVARTPTRYACGSKLRGRASCRGRDAALAVAAVATMMMRQRLTLIFCSVAVQKSASSSN